MSQIEYSPDDDSLALATDVGFQVLNAQTFDVIWRDSDADRSEIKFAS